MYTCAHAKIDWCLVFNFGRLQKQILYAENVKVKVRAVKEHLQAPYTALESEVFANKMPTLPTLLRFHPYDIRLAVADSDTISLVTSRADHYAHFTWALVYLQFLMF